MVFRSSPSLGPDIEQIIPKDGFWFEGPGREAGGKGQPVSPVTGNPEHVNNAKTGVWVTASADIAAATAPGTQLAVTVTASGATAVAGSGGFYPGKPNVAIKKDDTFYAVKAI